MEYMKKKAVYESKECFVCGSLFTRKQTEGVRSFSKRRACSPKCGHKLIKKPAPPKQHTVCGVWMEMNKTEGQKRFNQRKTCSVECGNAFNHTYHPDPKLCKWCGETFERKPTEAREQFESKEFCSPFCFTSHRSNEGIEKRSQHVKQCVICETPFIRRANESHEWFANRSTCGDTCGRALGGITNSVPIEDRFWDKVDIGDVDSCWKWIDYTNRDGYGMVRANGKADRAHRVVWELTNGAIPEGMLIRHLCNNPPCCNPNHLALGTKWLNSQDMVKSGRALFGSRCPFAKLSENAVREIREAWNDGLVPANQLAPKYNVSPDTILDIVNRKSWNHI